MSQWHYLIVLQKIGEKMTFDDTDEIRMIEDEIIAIRKKIIKSFGTDRETELKQKLKMLQKRKSKLVRRK